MSRILILLILSAISACFQGPTVEEHCTALITAQCERRVACGDYAPEARLCTRDGDCEDLVASCVRPLRAACIAGYGPGASPWADEDLYGCVEALGAATCDGDVSEACSSVRPTP